MRYGDIVTVEELNERFLRIYSLANAIVPDLSLLITTAQISYAPPLSGYNVGRHFPSKFGVQYFENDAEGLMLAELTNRIDRILGE